MLEKERVLKIIESSRRMLDGIVILLFSAMFIVVTLNVIMRFVFNNPIAVSGELARYLFISIIYLGSIIAFKDNAHIGLDIIIENFPSRARAIVHIIDRILVSIFLILFSYASLKMAMISIDIKSSAMFIPMAIPYLPLAISGIGMLLELLINVSGIEKKDRR